VFGSVTSRATDAKQALSISAHDRLDLVTREPNVVARQLQCPQRLDSHLEHNSSFFFFFEKVELTCVSLVADALIVFDVLCKRIDQGSTIEQRLSADGIELWLQQR
jgi:hypothetical protein